MKRTRLFLLLCCGWLTAAQAQITLNGNLLTDAEKPVPATRIGVTAGPGDITDSKGQFSIKLPLDFIEGERVLLVVDKKDWLINHPLDGEWNLPAKKWQEASTQYTKVIIVPKGSKALWTHARIEKHIALLSDEIAKLKKEGDKPKPVDFSYYISEWADKYGFKPAEVKAAFDQWASAVKDSTDKRTKALREFYQRNFVLAARYFDEAADEGEAELKEIEEARRQKVLEIYQNRKDAGNSLSTVYQFAEALTKYEKASALVPREDFPGEWAEIRIFIGNTKQDIGTRCEGAKAAIFLKESEQAYREAFEIYTREQLPQQWAKTQNNLGSALQEQGIRIGGEASAALLAQAAAAYQNALQVYSREQLPQDWAMTQNNLGTALQEQGIRTGGEAGTDLLAQAVVAYQNALQVRTREQLPQQWATTQNNLGLALQAQGIRAGGEGGAALLAQAVVAYQNALQVYAREQLPQQWAAAQNNLGNTLQAQGIRTSGEGGAALLAQAVAAYQNALQVYTHEQLPQQWATTQNNLGRAFQAQGIRTGGEGGAALLAQAVAAYQNASQVYTREQLPQQWAATQINLGAALKAQGIRTDGETGAALLAQAVVAYQNALQVYTREQLPQPWATTQNNLGNALKAQGIRTGGEGGAALLAQAVAAYQNALQVYTREQLPQDWAMTQNNLGTALSEQGIHSGGEAGAALLAQAVAALKASLEVRTFEQLPVDWAQSQNNLAKSYTALEDWPNVALCYANVLQVYPDHEQAYQTASYLYHEVLHQYPADYASAFALNENWLRRHPEDLSAQCDFAEKHFTSGRFPECEQRLAALLTNAEIKQSSQIALRAIQIANFAALQQIQRIPATLETLQQTAAAQPDTLQVGWSFEGTKHYISVEPQLAHYRDWLLQLLAAIEIKEGREAILAALRQVEADLKTVINRDK
ncbi:hypothetical protein JW998_11345 [candidate division KSB1 bacterium]|nr:hypothetical protein [candidate division KSB1 bacterium]